MSINPSKVKLREASLSVESNDLDWVIRGKWFRIAKVRDEELVEGDVLPDPRIAIAEIKRRIRADMMTFLQVSYGAMPVHDYPDVSGIELPV